MLADPKHLQKDLRPEKYRNDEKRFIDGPRILLREEKQIP